MSCLTYEFISLSPETKYRFPHSPSVFSLNFIFPLLCERQFPSVPRVDLLTIFFPLIFYANPSLSNLVTSSAPYFIPQVFFATLIHDLCSATLDGAVQLYP